MSNFVSDREGTTWRSVSENRMWRRIYGTSREAVTGLRRKLLSEQLHILFFSPSIVVTKGNQKSIAETGVADTMHRGDNIS
jgi:hypothetical protein